MDEDYGWWWWVGLWSTRNWIVQNTINPMTSPEMSTRKTPGHHQQLEVLRVCVPVIDGDLKPWENHGKTIGKPLNHGISSSLSSLFLQISIMFIFWVLFKVIFYFPNRKSTIWGIYSEVFLFFGNPLSKSKYLYRFFFQHFGSAKLNSSVQFTGAWHLQISVTARGDGWKGSHWKTWRHGMQARSLLGCCFFSMENIPWRIHGAGIFTY